MSPAPRDAQPSRAFRLPRFVLKLTVSLALLGVLFRQTTPARLSDQLREVSLGWLVVALGLYFLMILASAWRWNLLLRAQEVTVPGRQLVASFLVATFFNNFLPSNIGGDIMRIRDTAPAARSKTMATLIVLVDRLLGLIGLLFVAAVGALGVGLVADAGPPPIWPPLIWIGLAVLGSAFVLLLWAPESLGHALEPFGLLRSGWISQRVERLSAALSQFRRRPGELLACLAGAVGVQGVLVLFYLAITHSLQVHVSVAHLAVLVPMSFLAQMVPVSVNGFGVREATFSYYFASLQLPVESALLVSLLGVAVTLAVSLTGAVVYVGRR